MGKEGFVSEDDFIIILLRKLLLGENPNNPDSLDVLKMEKIAKFIGEQYMSDNETKDHSIFYFGGKMAKETTEILQKHFDLKNPKDQFIFLPSYEFAKVDGVKPKKEALLILANLNAKDVTTVVGAIMPLVVAGPVTKEIFERLKLPLQNFESIFRGKLGIIIKKEGPVITVELVG